MTAPADSDEQMRAMRSIAGVMGTVYVVQMGVDGPIKIGWTGADDPASRVCALQTACPYRLRLLGTVPGTMDDEGAAHAQLAPHATDGGSEWFEWSEETKAVVTRLLEGFRMRPIGSRANPAPKPRRRRGIVSEDRTEANAAFRHGLLQEAIDAFPPTPRVEIERCLVPAHDCFRRTGFAPVEERDPHSLAQYLRLQRKGEEITARALVDAARDLRRQAAIWIGAALHPLVGTSSHRGVPFPWSRAAQPLCISIYKAACDFTACHWSDLAGATEPMGSTLPQAPEPTSPIDVARLAHYQASSVLGEYRLVVGCESLGAPVTPQVRLYAARIILRAGTPAFSDEKLREVAERARLLEQSLPREEIDEVDRWMREGIR